MEPLDPWGETLVARILIEQMNKEYNIRIFHISQELNYLTPLRKQGCHFVIKYTRFHNNLKVCITLIATQINTV